VKLLSGNINVCCTSRFSVLEDEDALPSLLILHSDSVLPWVGKKLEAARHWPVAALHRSELIGMRYLHDKPRVHIELRPRVRRDLEVVPARLGDLE
jgi:hypothetical protein